ncbi:MAG TPA: M56 family metallopeptidase, partial [Isosphaeraceae bacterium]|nr:M56 family metallopeptidase [Isosphaeraceae bacterium]
MNELGALFVGAAARCTAFAVVGALLYALLRRKGPSAGALAALTTLMMLVGISALSLSPWPRWWTVAPPAAMLSPRPQVPLNSAGPAAQVAPGTVGESPSLSDRRPAQVAADDGELHTAPFLRALWQALQQPAVAARSSHWDWRAWCVVLFLAGTALGCLRLLLGLRAVQTLRRRSVAIDDETLRDMVDILRAEASCTRNVEVHASAEITTPATVGWLRPLILLPAGWREWDERERRVVLAHELAHVCRNDYLSGLLAQLSLAVHFYHPLAHWLLGRLRLQQELAADSWGARLAGGNPLYLATLAQMALRQADRPVSWPARAFLPTRGTFLRRIEMLRDAQTLPPTSLSRLVRMFTIGALATAGLLIAGLRGGDRPSSAQAAQPPAGGPGSGAANAPYDLTYVPAATDMLLALRPATVLPRPEFNSLV